MITASDRVSQLLLHNFALQFIHQKQTPDPEEQSDSASGHIVRGYLFCFFAFCFGFLFHVFFISLSFYLVFISTDDSIVEANGHFA